MKTFLSDIFPKIQRYSEKLDNFTFLTNQYWVSIDDILSSKTVYIFRTNYELLVSTNGKIEKAKWEYLGNKSLLIDKNSDSYLFVLFFIDENIMVLKQYSKDEYAVFVNENKNDGELNSIQSVSDFLIKRYLKPSSISNIETKTGQTITTYQTKSTLLGGFDTDKGKIKVELNFEGAFPAINNKVYQNDVPAKDGNYKLGFMSYLIIKDGIVYDYSVF